MTNALNATAGRIATNERRTPGPTPPAAKEGKRGTPAVSPIRTLLVASCGWPTDAAVPARRRTPRR